MASTFDRSRRTGRTARSGFPERVAERLTGAREARRRSRLAYRDVASSTNRLTLIAAIVPPGVLTTHTLFCSREASGPGVAALPLRDVEQLRRELSGPTSGRHPCHRVAHRAASGAQAGTHLSRLPAYRRLRERAAIRRCGDASCAAAGGGGPPLRDQCQPASSRARHVPAGERGGAAGGGRGVRRSTIWRSREARVGLASPVCRPADEARVGTQSETRAARTDREPVSPEG